MDDESAPEGEEVAFEIECLNDEKGVCTRLEENESCIIYEISRVQCGNKMTTEKGKIYSANTNNQNVHRLLGAGLTPTVAVMIKSKLSGKVCQSVRIGH